MGAVFPPVRNLFFGGIPLPLAIASFSAICPWNPKFGGLIWKEVGDFDLEGGGQRGDYHQGGITFPALYATNIRPVMFRPVGKLFLAPTTFLPEGTQALTEFALYRLHMGMRPGYSL